MGGSAYELNPVHLRRGRAPTWKTALHDDRRGDQLQRDAKRKRRIVIAAPALNEAEQCRTERADGAAGREGVHPV